jgi:capsular exopolysaccharide synthesis family protein
MSERDITIAAMLSDLRRRAWLILATTVAAAALAFGFSLLQPDRYEATTNLLFTGDQNAGAPERTAATNLALATSDAVVLRVQRDFLFSFSVKELRRRVSISPKGQADIVEVKATGDTRHQAVQLADDFAKQIVAVRVERAKAERNRAILAIDQQLRVRTDASSLRKALAQRRRDLIVAQALEDGGVSVAGEAFGPAQRSQPRPARNAAVGGATGLLFALLLALGLRERGRELDEAQVVALTRCQVLARVPKRGGGWRQEAFLEAIQFLRTNLSGTLDHGSGSRPLVVAITSPRPGDGKSTIVEALARAMTDAGRSVVLVDADLRRGVLGERLGRAAAEGLAEALIDGRVGRRVRTTASGILLLSRGTSSQHALARVDADSVAEVLNSLRGMGDVVLVDTAPVSIAAETSDIAAAADAVVLVVDVGGGDDAASLQAARAQLDRVEARVVGVVLNKAAMQHRRDRAAYEAYGLRAIAPAPAPASIDHDDAAPSRPGASKAKAPTSSKASTSKRS